MHYHAILTLPSGGSIYFCNLNKDEIIAKVLIPYIQKQHILDNFSDLEGDGLINLGMITCLVGLKTDAIIDESLFKIKNPSTIITQIRNKNIYVEVCTKELIANSEIDLANNRILKSQLLSEKKQVFVVMKIGDNELDSAYESMKGVIKDFDLDCIRIDEVESANSITDQILSFINDSKYVLVELTGNRPNCYYEAGYADALGKEIIYVIKKGEDIHFDLKHRKFIIWETESDLRKKLTNRFTSLKSKKSGSIFTESKE